MERILDPCFLFSVMDGDIASKYSAQLLTDLGANVHQPHCDHGGSTENRWRDSGLADLTGLPKQPLPNCPVPVAEYGDGTLQALEVLSSKTLTADRRGADLMAMRATWTGDSRRGDVSLGGSCRFLACTDGTIAINLSRESDWELLEAWLLTEVAPDWHSVERHVRELPKSHLLEQGRLLGLAVADANPSSPGIRCWYDLVHSGVPSTERNRPARVIDLSSLWAGPLCGQLLRWCGAEVLKVESSARPDGARFGSTDFFQFLNKGKSELTLELHKESGVKALVELIRSADIIIEASRPRALRQMGIVAEDLIEEIPGLTWISITGYGREEPQANWIAYGDDAGVAGGLSAEIYRATGKWMFCGDAIADPLTGMHAALAGYASWMSGGGHLLSLSLVQTVQNCVQTQLNLDHRGAT